MGRVKEAIAGLAMLLVVSCATPAPAPEFPSPKPVIVLYRGLISDIKPIKENDVIKGYTIKLDTHSQTFDVYSLERSLPEGRDVSIELTDGEITSFESHYEDYQE